MVGKNHITYLDENKYLGFINHKNKDIKQQNYKCDISIICSRFNKENIFQARMLSYNKNGMYFESPLYLKKGVNILFKIKEWLPAFFDAEICEGLRTTSIGEVIHCKKIEDNACMRFGTEVKYHSYY